MYLHDLSSRNLKKPFVFGVIVIFHCVMSMWV
jgi:hypothetical protein